MSKRLLLFNLLFLSIIASVGAQDLSVYKYESFGMGKDSMHYRILYPIDYDSTKEYPIVLFLHGIADRGNDNHKQLAKGGSFFADEQRRKNYPAFVVFPQCPSHSFWSSLQLSFDSASRRPLMQFPENGSPSKAMKLLQELTKQLLATLPIKKDQVYVGGLSMGGMGTYEIVNRMPGVFAAAFPICGGANKAIAPNLANTSWWIFHGDSDPVVPFHFSQDMADALKEQGAEVKFTAYPGVLHNSWNNAFAEPELLPWLFSQRLHQKASNIFNRQAMVLPVGLYICRTKNQ